MIARWQVDLIAARKRLRQHPARRRGGVGGASHFRENMIRREN
jgi:hypothetical protein